VEAYSTALEAQRRLQAASGLLSRVVVMASQKDCIEFANQCVRLADLCEDDPQLREHFLELAREWMAMAAQDTVDT
jgi:hypothetical protein